jgi:hypothetical protein
MMHNDQEQGVRARFQGPDGKQLQDGDRGYVLFTEHKRERGRQVRREIGRNGEIDADLPPGTYTVQAWRPGYGVTKTVVEVEKGQRPKLDLKLTEAPRKPRGFAERLGHYVDGLDPERIEDLTVERGEDVVLGPRSAGYHALEARSIDDLKRWTGSRDKDFGHDRPRFGKLPEVDRKDVEPRRSKADFQKVSETGRRFLEHVAHEYIHGNAVAVKEYHKVLDDYVKLIYPGGLVIPAFLLKIVTVQNGATLTVAPNSVLVADILRVHNNGRLVMRKNSSFDVGTYETFG